MILLRSIDILGLLRLIPLVKLSIIPLVILIPLLILITQMKSRLLLIHMCLIRLVLIMWVVLVLCPSIVWDGPVSDDDPPAVST